LAILRASTSAGGPGRNGQALTEFALVAPILFFLIMAIFQFAFVLEAQIGLTNAVREAARRGAASPATSTTALGSYISSQLTGGGLLASNVQGFQTSRMAGGSPTVSFCQYTVGSVTSDQVSVAVTYGYPVFFPLLSFATDAVDGAIDNAWTLTATAQMKLEANTTDTPAATCAS
jgi:Flp pilus assembly protein TadG